jgi:hypothetical protein
MSLRGGHRPWPHGQGYRGVPPPDLAVLVKARGLRRPHSLTLVATGRIRDVGPPLAARWGRTSLRRVGGWRAPSLATRPGLQGSAPDVAVLGKARGLRRPHSLTLVATGRIRDVGPPLAARWGRTSLRAWVAGTVPGLTARATGTARLHHRRRLVRRPPPRPPSPALQS